MSSAVSRTASRHSSKQTAPAGAKAPKNPHRWSAEVSKTSDALDLKSRIFKQRSSKAIAESLKQSAEGSKRRKSSPFRSAMSMLNFYINRAGKNISATERTRLEGAKAALRRMFGKTERKSQ